MHILGMFGPWQMIFIFFLLVILPGLLIAILIVNNSRNKAKAQKLENDLNKQETKGDDVIEKLEKLNHLRESGALTDEEFEAQKKKVLD